MAGLRSFTGMRGFRSRGQLGAWMARVGSSTVSCGWRRPWWGGGRVAWYVGIPLRQNDDGRVHELQEVERKVMACSDWTLGARSGGFPVSCCSPELEGMAAAF